MIGIIAALEEELQSVLKYMSDVTTSERAQLKFYKGKIDEKDVVLVRCGVGKVNAASCTQVIIDLFGVDTVINVGVGGLLVPGYGIGDIAISQSALQYDMDATCFGTPKTEIPNMGMSFFPADEKLVTIAKESADSIGINSLVGNIMTADLGLDDPELKAFLVKEYEGIACDMEGAAIAQVAYINNIPYLVIRSFSDNADGDAGESYENNLESSADNAGKLIKQIISSLD